jgi:hypothetical protein
MRDSVSYAGLGWFLNVRDHSIEFTNQEKWELSWEWHFTCNNNRSSNSPLSMKDDVDSFLYKGQTIELSGLHVKKEAIILFNGPTEYPKTTSKIGIYDPAYTWPVSIPVPAQAAREHKGRVAYLVEVNATFGSLPVTSGKYAMSAPEVGVAAELQAGILSVGPGTALGWVPPELNEGKKKPEATATFRKSFLVWCDCGEAKVAAFDPSSDDFSTGSGDAVGAFRGFGADGWNGFSDPIVTAKTIN